jgi:hypothetical protein
VFVELTKEVRKPFATEMGSPLETSSTVRLVLLWFCIDSRIRVVRQSDVWQKLSASTYDVFNLHVELLIVFTVSVPVELAVKEENSSPWAEV